MPSVREFFYNRHLSLWRKSFFIPLFALSQGTSMNIFLKVFKAFVLILVMIAAAAITALAAFFGSSLLPSRLKLPEAGVPRSKVWTDEERRQYLSRNTSNVV